MEATFAFYFVAMSYPPESLQPLLESVAKLLTESSTTVSIAESTTGESAQIAHHDNYHFLTNYIGLSHKGGLISAALLSIPGAATYYKGGTVLYTLEARSEFCGWTEKDTEEYRWEWELIAS